MSLVLLFVHYFANKQQNMQCDASLKAQPFATSLIKSNQTTPCI